MLKLRAQLKTPAHAVPGFVFALGVLLAACSGGTPASAPPSSSPGSGMTTVNVALTNDGCVPDRSSVPAGAITFSVINEGGDAVSEVELTSNDRILGERENLAPGLSGTFTLELEPGSYLLECEGATTPQTTFVVTPAAAAQSPAGALDDLLEQAADGYAGYVRDQTAQLVAATNYFSGAITAGDIERAKSLYGPARVFYERIEPVAESFGDLDHEIDGRVDGAATPDDFTGFHRLEQALWQTGNLDGMTPIAQKLIVDVGQLQTLVATETYQPAQLANGAAELLDEISASKITGEEERYSGLDLIDFQANLDGARAAFDFLRPALDQVDAQLSGTIATRFDAVQQALNEHRAGDGFVAYAQLNQDQTRALGQAVDSLAEPMSEVAAKLVG